MTGRGDDRKLMGRLARNGYMVLRAERTGHWKVFDSRGRLLGVAGGTPSDRRSRRNFIKDLERNRK